jgi:malate dehydrogenase
MNKISVIGVGRVGECVAQQIAENNLCKELMLVDVRSAIPQSVALDIMELYALHPSATRVNGCNDASGLADSELVVICTGLARSEDHARAGFLKVAARMVDDMVASIALYAPNATILMVSTPVEVMTYQAFLCSGFERSQVVGHGGVLDAARLAGLISMETGFSASEVKVMVIGGQGDMQVPLVRYATVGGIPLTQLLDEASIDDIVERAQSAVAEILSLRKSSPAYDLLAWSVTRMVDCMAHDRRCVLPAAAVLDGEYGQHNLALGVPCVLGRHGIERIIEVPLADDEQFRLALAADKVKDNIAKLE